MFLKEVVIKSAKPQSKPYKLSDGDGLYMLVNPSNSKLWRFKYRFNEKENTFSIGSYPEISLSEAREERYRLRKLIKAGTDPNMSKKITKLTIAGNHENSFEQVAMEWHNMNIKKWTGEHGQKLKNWLKKEVIPFIGNMPLNEVKAPHILAVVRKVEARGAYDIARRVLNICSQVLRYGMLLGKCDYDVTVGMSKALEYFKSEHYKCVSPEELPRLLQTIEKHNCKLLTKFGLQMVALTFVRSAELREAKWFEINFEKQEWRIPAERMKMKELHIVPLSNQAIKILKAIQALNLGSEFIFPSERSTKKTMSENTMLYALYDMGYHNKMTVHGFRQLASTILNENGFNPDAIERQLSHSERNNVRRAYNHAQYLPERKQMMQWWADYLTNLTNEW